MWHYSLIQSAKRKLSKIVIWKIRLRDLDAHSTGQQRCQFGVFAAKQWEFGGFLKFGRTIFEGDAKISFGVFLAFSLV